ncbi:MAG: ABC transporter permease subunit [Nitrososphaeria archaeon]
MRLDKVVLVFKKDWIEVRRNWQVTLPIIIVPLMISVLLPVLLTTISHITGSSGASLSDFENLIRNMPTHVQERVKIMSEKQAMVYIMALYFFAQFFLIIPLMASSVITSDSFAGEKERKTIEALLATPISDGELFLGKILVSFIPSMTVTIISFVIYSITFDILSYNMFNGELLLPNIDWLLLIFCLAPYAAKVKGFREAQQISAILLVPILALVFGQLSGAIFFGAQIIVLLTIIFGVIDLIIFKIGVRLFKREEVLLKLI